MAIDPAEAFPAADGDTEAPEMRDSLTLLAWSEPSRTQAYRPLQIPQYIVWHLCTVHQLSSWVPLTEEALGATCVRGHRRKLNRCQGYRGDREVLEGESTLIPSTRRDGQTFKEASIPGAFIFSGKLLATCTS